MTGIYSAVAVSAYIAILLFIGFLSYRKDQSSSEFIIGGRALNFWVTALAAHASDMSSWFLMGFPAMIFMNGMFSAWIGIGLWIFMFLNWQFVAPKIRRMTESYNAMTFSSFFESRYRDTSGVIRIVTAAMLFFFYTIYISAGLVGLGILIDALFGVDYVIGITISLCVVIPYLFIGGYTTLAWTDLFQGLFLMAVVVFVPIYVMKIDHFSFASLAEAAGAKGASLTLVPDRSWWEPFKILNVVLGWGLGYFGLPHIITKFMGIKKVSDMRKAQIVGMTWQAITMAAVVWIGFIGMAYFANGLNNPELVFIDMVKGTFHPLLSGFILCAIFAATISTMDSQILVLASTLSEDFYHRLINKRATSEQVVKASRISIFLVSAIAYVIAFFKIDTIYKLVEYAWSGLGASFGPILLFALYSKKTSKGAAWAGIIVGGVISAFWPLIDRVLQTGILPIIPGFGLSALALWVGNGYSDHKR